MTSKFKRKIVDKYFDTNKSLTKVFGIPYKGVLLSWHPTKRVLVQWHGVYQILTCSTMFDGALVKTYYDDQIDSLIRTINFYKV